MQQLPLGVGGWIPILINRKTDLQGITNITYDNSNLAVYYTKASGAITHLILTSGIWKEVGYGEYWVFLGPTIANVIGLITVHVTYPNAFDYPGAAEVLNVPADGDWLGMVLDNYDEDELGGVLLRIYQRLVTGTLQVIAPVIQEGAVIQIIRGDDYANADGRALEWLESDSNSGWPDLTDATVTLYIDDQEIEGTVVQIAGEADMVRFELTALETNTFSVGVHLFWIKAELDVSKNVVTLRNGRVYVSDINTITAIPETE